MTNVGLHKNLANLGFVSQGREIWFVAEGGNFGPDNSCLPQHNSHGGNPATDYLFPWSIVSLFMESLSSACQINLSRVEPNTGCNNQEHSSL